MERSYLGKNKKLEEVSSSVVDQHRFEADSDPTFNFDADLDPTLSFKHVGKSDFFTFIQISAGFNCSIFVVSIIGVTFSIFSTIF
jgi:hypothetical protein